MSLARLRSLFGLVEPGGAQSASSQASAVDLAYTIAVLLLEVAWADHDVSELERQTAADALRGLTGLGLEDVLAALQRAEAHIAEHVGVVEFTSELMARWSYAQRCALIEALWRVALAEAGISPVEESRIRHISDLLYVEHGDFINAKIAARDGV